ncbi:zf-HC2 domain-containing protein [Actinomadura spongiicola]|uniref:Zf-HC2 domain-containing protein n=1 Tax=Actinomadura spongiicola TaxID=2303421 RepID=A0A372GCZ7_9ACTN|nr:zf-HC2 domain-containing protein [Actinomadura spongiicola]RFS83052.1 zf-HC2 domain-containing protein [Actinomadura spongiicola]
MTSRIEHTDIGAYALGLLEEDDRRAFETHLAQCASCAEELGEMSGMAEALSGLGEFTGATEGVDREIEVGGATGAAEAASATASERPPAEVIDLLRRERRSDRRRRRGTYVIGAAAAAALIGTGVTVGAGLGGDGLPARGHGHGPAQALVVSGERHTGSDARTGVNGLVGLSSVGWGTHVGLELKGVRGPLRCRLEAVSRTGERTVVTAWQVPVKGYGVPGSPEPLITHGGTPIQRKDLDRFEVRIEGGGTLLTIPI